MLSLISAVLASPGMDAALTLAWLAIAVSVTVDVLLTNSDVRAALGWIAAAWLSPILGGTLYFLFGINRVTRRALKLTRRFRKATWPGHGTPPALDENIAQLADISGRVIGGELTGGNLLTPLNGGDEAYPKMLAAIQGARKGVVLASYIFRNDEAGRRFADALIAARARGVQVRVLAAPARLNEVIEACFVETATIGLRHHVVRRAVLARGAEEVEVDGRRLRVKTVRRPGGQTTGKTEAIDVAGESGHAARRALRSAGEAEALARLAARRSEAEE